MGSLQGAPLRLDRFSNTGNGRHYKPWSDTPCPNSTTRRQNPKPLPGRCPIFGKPAKPFACHHDKLQNYSSLKWQTPRTNNSAGWVRLRPTAVRPTESSFASNALFYTTTDKQVTFLEEAISSIQTHRWRSLIQFGPGRHNPDCTWCRSIRITISTTF